MKISKLSKFAGFFFALALGTTSIFAQGYGYGRNGNFVSETHSCLEELSGLTQDQTDKIEALETSHEEKMAELRENRRSTNNAIEKQEIRDEMLEIKEDHQNAVKSLLNDQQKEEYEQLHANGGQHLYVQNNNPGYGHNAQGLGKNQRIFNNRRNIGNHPGYNNQHINTPRNYQYRNNRF